MLINFHMLCSIVKRRIRSNKDLLYYHNKYLWEMDLRYLVLPVEVTSQIPWAYDLNSASARFLDTKFGFCLAEWQGYLQWMCSSQRSSAYVYHSPANLHRYKLELVGGHFFENKPLFGVPFNHLKILNTASNFSGPGACIRKCLAPILALSQSCILCTFQRT